MARIVFDLDQTLVGFFPKRNPTELRLNRQLLAVARRHHHRGDTLILWTLGNREWWREVRRTFPELRGVFHEVYTRDELPGHVTVGRGFAEPVKDIRVVNGDVLIDNNVAHEE